MISAVIGVTLLGVAAAQEPAPVASSVAKSEAQLRELALKVELTKNKTLGPGRHRRFGGVHQWEGEPCLACELGTRGSTF